MGKLLTKVNIGQELVALNVKHSEQRFLQLIYNILMKEYGTANLGDGKLYNLTDEELLKVIKQGEEDD
ncbi:MAG: hypothetical protein J6F30_04205 [Cellulosilyticum sp.]|nr:hypothetical protein [Cellulosilyticum sp.]